MKQNDLVTNKVFETYKEEFQNFKDDLFNRLDNIVGQLETMRDEQTLAYHQHKELE
ncbi:MAG TPA: hypothetical protein VF189_06925 [Patescibacteria group bacterium]